MLPALAVIVPDSVMFPLASQKKLDDVPNQPVPS
jgi:hypothetical protein